MTEVTTSRQFEIIEAAGKILTNSGVGGLTIKNLANEMNFSEAAIYRHFTGKEKIVIAMLDYLVSNMDERFTAALNNNQNAEDKFITLFQNQFQFFKKNPHFGVVIFSDGLLDESLRINESISKIMEVKIKHLTPIILEGQKNGIFINTIPESELLHIIMGSIRLQMYKWRVANFSFDIVTTGDKMIQSLLSLIKTK